MKRLPRALLFLISFVVELQASRVTIPFSGTVGSVGIDDFSTGIAFGDPLSGSFTFDNLATDNIPADNATGSYTSAGLPFGMTFSIGLNTFDAFDFLNIGVFNAQVDQYTVYAKGTNGALDLTLELFFQDQAATALTNDELPPWGPEFSAFALKTFRIDLVNTETFAETQVDGVITSNFSPVPEPSTGLLLAAGMAALCFSRKNRRL